MNYFDENPVVHLCEVIPMSIYTTKEKYSECVAGLIGIGMYIGIGLEGP